MPSPALRPSPGEMVLPFEGGLPPQVMGIDWEKRISFSRLLNVISASQPSLESMGRVTTDQLAIIDPVAINDALLVGADTSAIPTAYNGIVLPDDDFLAVAGNPYMFAKRTMAQTGRSRKNLSTPEATEAAKLRSAGHVLEKKIAKITARREAVETQNAAVKVVSAEVRGKGAAHYRASSLYPKVITARDAVAEMVEVAGTRLGWSVDEHSLAKDALYAQLLGLRGDANQRTKNWIQYSGDAARYGRRRVAILQSAASKTERALYRYKPALDANRT